MAWPAHHPGPSPSRLPPSSVSGSAPAPSSGPSLPSPPPKLMTPPRIANNAAASAVDGAGAGDEEGGLGPPPATAMATAGRAGGEAVEGLPDSLPLTGLTFDGVFSPTQVRRKIRCPTCDVVCVTRYPWYTFLWLSGRRHHGALSHSDGAWNVFRRGKRMPSDCFSRSCWVFW